MPKKVQPLIAVAPVAALIPPPPPSPIIQRLRQDWRWAAISQFIWTFSDAFGLLDWDIEALEADLDGDETHILPDLLAKLLFALTYNRQINRDNAFDNLRKQYLKKAPEATVLGTVEEPVEWATLGLSQKVQILWELCEWQLNDAARFRALLKNEDDAASWRIDPIGWDKAGNTYFLFDDNRLWVQHQPPAPPRPPKKSSLKAKRAEKALKRSRPSSSKPKQPHKKKPAPEPLPTPPPKAEIEEVVSGPRKRTQVAFYGNLTPTIQALKRGGQTATPPSSRGMRSSTRLHGGDAGPSTPSSNTTPSKSRTTPLPLGTRVSRRLREVDDEWQQVPDEWLGEGKPNGKAKGQRKRDTEEESELSELTDEEEHERRLRMSQGRTSSPPSAEDIVAKEEEESDDQLTPPPEEEQKEEAREDQELDSEDGKHEEMEVDEVEVDGEADGEKEEMESDEVKDAAKQANELPEGFVEWEAVCVTLYDWRTFPEQFAKSRDPDEKALYQMLTQEVGPTIIEVLVAKEQEKIKQAAVLNRKRSSRIATKELEREEMIRREKAQKEMEERMEVQRREETRKEREEAELAAREKAREERLKEREERAAAREQAIQQKLLDEQEAKEAAMLEREARKRRRELGLDVESDDTPGSGTVTPRLSANGNGGTGERWELACEVCRKQGWNVDEDLDLVCCDDCSRWQHTECHDRQDTAEGRPKRNWDKVDFKCKDCRRKAARKRQRLESEASPQNGPRIPSQPQAYQLVNGSAPGPSPPRDPSRPPAPTLQQGQYYLPYPPGGQTAPPAGYAVYYPPNGHGSTSQSPTGHSQSPSRPPQISPQARPFAPPQAYPPPHHAQGPSQHQNPPQAQRSPSNLVHGAVPHGQAHPFGPDPRRQAPPPVPSPGQPYQNGHVAAPRPEPGQGYPPRQQLPQRSPQQASSYPAQAQGQYPRLPAHPQQSPQSPYRPHPQQSPHAQHPQQQQHLPRPPPLFPGQSQAHPHPQPHPQSQPHPHLGAPSNPGPPQASQSPQRSSQSPQLPPPHRSYAQQSQPQPQQQQRWPAQVSPSVDPHPQHPQHPHGPVLAPIQGHAQRPSQAYPPQPQAVQSVHEQSK